MTDKVDTQVNDTASDVEKERRDFLKKAGAAGMTAPAVAMLLSTEAKAQSVDGYNQPTPAPEPTPRPET